MSTLGSMHGATWVIIAVVTALIAFALIAILRNGFSTRTSLPPMDFPTWDPANCRESLDALHATTLRQGEAAIGWYRDNIRSKRAGSRVLRSIAIVLASIGALLPLVVAGVSRFAQSDSSLKLMIDAQWGYIAFATAAACVAADKFYGFSTGWIRYMKTQLVLESALSDLRYDWIALVARLAGQQPSADQIQLMLQRLKDFVAFVRGQVEQETDAWVLEFQSNLSDLASTVKSRAESGKPGSLQLTVSNARDFEGGIKAFLDHTDERTVKGSQCLFPAIPPGVHEVLVRGTKGETAFEAATVVKIAPDSLASLSVSVPHG
jgi:hypothetical protein